MRNLIQAVEAKYADEAAYRAEIDRAWGEYKVVVRMMEQAKTNAALWRGNYDESLKTSDRLRSDLAEALKALGKCTEQFETYERLIAKHKDTAR